MKRSTTLIMLGTLTLALLAFAFATVQAKPAENVLLQTTATPAGTTDADASTQAVASTNVVVWDKFCVQKIPYTIIALPQNASFEIAPPAENAFIPTPVKGTSNSNEMVCNSVGTYRDMQVVVCRGPQLVSIPQNVTSDGGSEEFLVPMGACPIPSDVISDD
jgi:hypothetical protein